MKIFLVIFGLMFLTSCGKNGKDGQNGADGGTSFGVNGADAISTGVDFSDITPGLVCANGGISIFTFRDENSDGFLQSSELIIKTKSVCNGSDGLNSSVILEGIVSSDTCPQGGVKISSSNSVALEVCNGVNGLNGEQGIQGIQGVPGIAGSNGVNGSNGASVVPVKFCSSDSSAFPEYGLMVGSELYAVYWGATPASPNASQAFLTKLVAGNYQSTGGNNCLFSVP